MKKHNDGYALPFVLVVMVVVCLIAVSVMTFSLRCLRSQQASIQQMQEKYTALGEVEKVIANLELARTAPITIEENEVFHFTDSTNTFVVESEGFGYRVTITAATISENGDGTYTIGGLSSIAYSPLEQEGSK